MVLHVRLPSASGADSPAQPPSAKRKIVLIAGPKSHGPVGNGMHDYGWSVSLLHMMLERSNIKDKIEVAHYLDGWPKNRSATDGADTIMIVSDGRDGDKFSEALHIENDERVQYVDSLMKRGCGLVTFHFSTFAPEKYADRVLDWTGGYFKWETAGKKEWYSNLTTKEAEVRIATSDHPVARGLKPLTMREEFYYNLKFKDGDGAVKPIWIVPALGGREPDGNVVAWARERADGGRGFGTTCGHYYDNWQHAQFRKLILNALAWTAKVDVPLGGVEGRYFTHDEIRAAMGDEHVPAVPARNAAEPLSAGKK